MGTNFSDLEMSKKVTSWAIHTKRGASRMCTGFQALLDDRVLRIILGSITAFKDDEMISQFNGTSTPKGSYRAKTGDNDCNVNSSRYSLRTALCENIKMDTLEIKSRALDTDRYYVLGTFDFHDIKVKLGSSSELFENWLITQCTWQRLGSKIR